MDDRTAADRRLKQYQRIPGLHARIRLRRIGRQLVIGSKPALILFLCFRQILFELLDFDPLSVQLQLGKRRVVFQEGLSLFYIVSL